jgi:hypothetical protein
VTEKRGRRTKQPLVHLKKKKMKKKKKTKKKKMKSVYWTLEEDAIEGILEK